MPTQPLVIAKIPTKVRATGLEDLPTGYGTRLCKDRCGDLLMMAFPLDGNEVEPWYAHYPGTGWLEADPRALLEADLRRKKFILADSRGLDEPTAVRVRQGAWVHPYLTLEEDYDE